MIAEEMYQVLEGNYGAFALSRIVDTVASEERALEVASRERCRIENERVGLFRKRLREHGSISIVRMSDNHVIHFWRLVGPMVWLYTLPSLE